MSWTEHPSKSSGRCSTTTWRRLRLRILARDEYTCQLQLSGCLDTADQVDHIISVANGGPDTEENCRAVCKPCHDKITAQQASAGRRTRGKRRPRQHPADTLTTPGG